MINPSASALSVQVSIIIVNWNSVGYLEKCIDSVSRHSSDVSYEIIVIDSASYDGSAELIYNKYPAVKFLQSDINLGFARANNEAFKSAVGEYILFLNPDTELLSPAVGTLLGVLKENPGAGAVGARLLNGDGTLQTSCVQAFPTLINQFLNSEALRNRFPRSGLWGTRVLYDDVHNAEKVDVISGACLMLRRSSFEKVGFFSDEYFMYAEDVDLCCKLVRSGLRNYYVPQALVAHFGGGSSVSAPSEFSVQMMREARWRYFKKWNGVVYASIYRAMQFLSAVGRLALLGVLHIVAGWTSTPSRHAKSIRKWSFVLKWCAIPGGARRLP